MIDDLASPPPDPAPRRPGYTLRADQLLALSDSGAAARAPIRTAGLARFRAADGASRRRRCKRRIGASCRSPTDRRPRSIPAVKTWSEHLAALGTLNRAGATWQIVPAHELTD